MFCIRIKHIKINAVIQNGRYFADNISKCNFCDKNMFWCKTYVPKYWLQLVVDAIEWQVIITSSFNVIYWLLYVLVTYGFVGLFANKIWSLCLVPTSTTRFATDVGYRMAKKWVGLYKEIFFMKNDILFLNREWGTRYSLTNFGDHFLDCMPQLFLRPQYVWFLTHL